MEVVWLSSLSWGHREGGELTCPHQTALLPHGPHLAHLHQGRGLTSRAHLVPIESVHVPGAPELLRTQQKTGEARRPGQKGARSGFCSSVLKAGAMHGGSQRAPAEGDLEAVQELGGWWGPCGGKGAVPRLHPQHRSAWMLPHHTGPDPPANTHTLSAAPTTSYRAQTIWSLSCP